MVDSRLWKLSLHQVFVQLCGSTTFVLFFLELADKDCFGHACVFYPCDVASPTQLYLKQDGHYVGQPGYLEDFFI